MKHLFAVLFIILFANVANAQEHIKVFGHYIDEPNYLENLKKESKIWESDETGVYATYFGGKDIKVYANYVFRNRSLISNICFAKKCKTTGSFANIEKLEVYDYYKALFLEKYEMDANEENRENGSLECVSQFEIPNGWVKIITDKNDYYVRIYYVDRINNQLDKTAKENYNSVDDL